MKLSVIIPAYHCKNYIRECITSVLCQLPEDCEMIIVDDGSEDGTVNISGSSTEITKAHRPPGMRGLILRREIMSLFWTVMTACVQASS